MKEIDFIPEWYTANRNRRKRYHHQYILLVSVLAMLMAWSFVMGQYVERVRADVDEIVSVFDKGRMKIDEGMKLEIDMAALQHRLTLIETVTPRTDVSPVMAELSWLIRDNVVLSRLSMTSEKVDLKTDGATKPAGIVQIGAKTTEAASPFGAAARTKVTLTGIAAQGADAARLISRLEESDYFEQVLPVYTRAKKVKDRDVTEFEIRCFVADYRIEKD